MKILNLILIENFFLAAQEFSADNDRDAVNHTISKFKDLSQRASGNERDINYWRKQGFAAFEKYVSSLSASVSKRQTKTAIKSKDAIKILENDKAVVVVPVTKDASILYGKGTTWCTAATTSKNYFDEYYRDGITLIYFLCHDGSKFACSYDGGVRCFNAKDIEIPYEVIQDATGLTWDTVIAKVEHYDAAIEKNRYELGKVEDERIREFMTRPNVLNYPGMSVGTLRLVSLEISDGRILTVSSMRVKKIKSLWVEKDMDMHSIYSQQDFIIDKVLRAMAQTEDTQKANTIAPIIARNIYDYIKKVYPSDRDYAGNWIDMIYPGGEYRWIREHKHKFDEITKHIRAIAK